MPKSKNRPKKIIRFLNGRTISVLVIALSLWALSIPSSEAEKVPAKPKLTKQVLKLENGILALDLPREIRLSAAFVSEDQVSKQSVDSHFPVFQPVRIRIPEEIQARNGVFIRKDQVALYLDDTTCWFEGYSTSFKFNHCENSTGHPLSLQPHSIVTVNDRFRLKISKIHVPALKDPSFQRKVTVAEAKIEVEEWKESNRKLSDTQTTVSIVSDRHARVPLTQPAEFLIPEFLGPDLGNQPVETLTLQFDHIECSYEKRGFFGKALDFFRENPKDSEKYLFLTGCHSELIGKSHYEAGDFISAKQRIQVKVDDGNTENKLIKADLVGGFSEEEKPTTQDEVSSSRAQSSSES